VKRKQRKEEHFYGSFHFFFVLCSAVLFSFFGSSKKDMNEKDGDAVTLT
jgi:hypothetical protein